MNELVLQDLPRIACVLIGLPSPGVLDTNTLGSGDHSDASEADAEGMRVGPKDGPHGARMTELLDRAEIEAPFEDVRPDDDLLEEISGRQAADVAS